MHRYSGLRRTTQALAGALLLLAATALLARDPKLDPLLTGDFSGMYTFLQDGESVQLTLDPAPTEATEWTKPQKLTGFVSRLGNTPDDQDRILDHFFKSGSVESNRVRFTTKTVHGVWYEFEGKVQRDERRATRDKEGFYIIRGMLTEHVIDRNGKDSSRQRELTMKSFPNLDDPVPVDSPKQKEEPR